MSCCNSVLNLGEVGACADFIDLGMTAPTEGRYQIQLKFLNSRVTVGSNFEAGQPLRFSTSKLNENMEYEGRLLNPQGQAINITKSGSSYNCFTVTVKMQYAI